METLCFDDLPLFGTDSLWQILDGGDLPSSTSLSKESSTLSSPPSNADLFFATQLADCCKELPSCSSSSSLPPPPVAPKIDPFCLGKAKDFVVDGYELDPKVVREMKQILYREAVMRPVKMGREVAEERPRRRNVRMSSDPQTVAARRRRERLSDRLRALRKLVPGGSKMDTATMLEEAASYLKYLKSQIYAVEKERALLRPSQETAFRF